MDEMIEVSLNRIGEIIAGFPSDAEFTTAQVIKEYSGGFHSNLGTPAYYSFNAQFGKLLMRNKDNLGISPMQTSMAIKDDSEHPTTTSVWRRN